MEYVITVLEYTRKSLEQEIRDGDLLRNNMPKATRLLRQIKELKRGIKILRAKLN
jgi:hypothetical protein